METLVNSSDIFKKKIRFFLWRAFSYFSFLLLPVFITKSLNLNSYTYFSILVLYILFMASQWFLLGKEIDHRFKIYYRVNSSIDRVLYRILLGKFGFIFIFSLLALLPLKWVQNSFWCLWALLGLFYSWPTRGKIIQESVSSNLGEYRFLDSFERTVLSLIIVLFIVSIPELSNFNQINAIKLFYDPAERISSSYWNFIFVNYIPFIKHPNLLRLCYGLHFYLVTVGLFLFIFYAFLRYFLSRRLSLLGVFAVVSTWSISKILNQFPGDPLFSMMPLLFVWAMLWVAKSSTYRAGLFLGLVHYFSTSVHPANFFIFFFLILVVLKLSFEGKTKWYKRQLIKYTVFGSTLALVVFIMNFDKLETASPNIILNLKIVHNLIMRKSFYVLFFLGLAILVLRQIFKSKVDLQKIKLEASSLKLTTAILLPTLFLGSLSDTRFTISFGILWVISFLSLIPLEWIFQLSARLRSRRNMIYLVYILICLLDSHFEGRIKIFIRFLKGIQ